MLIRLQRIYNLWSIHAIILSIFGTNLLTGGPAQIDVFLPISVFRRNRISNGVQTEWNLRERDFLNKRDPGDLEWASRNDRGGHEAGGVPTPLGAPSTLMGPSLLHRRTSSYIYPCIPQTSRSATSASLCSHQKSIGTLFWHPAGGGIPHRWPSSSSRRYPWRGGSSSPSRLRICTSGYVFDLSLSCSLYGTILMYRELCYYSWILWCFSPSTLL